MKLIVIGTVPFGCTADSENCTHLDKYFELNALGAISLFKIYCSREFQYRTRKVPKNVTFSPNFNPRSREHQSTFDAKLQKAVSELGNREKCRQKSPNDFNDFARNAPIFRSTKFDTKFSSND